MNWILFWLIYGLLAVVHGVVFTLMAKDDVAVPKRRREREDERIVMGVMSLLWWVVDVTLIWMTVRDMIKARTIRRALNATAMR